MHKCLPAILAFLLLCACDSGVMDTEALMRPPMLNAQQAEVYAALGDSDIVYKYPQRGDNRTPFVFYDLDGDGLDEVIVFYSFENDQSNTRAKILRQEPDGWTPVHDISGGYDLVDFVQFAHLLSTESSCLMIGWRNSGVQSVRNAGSVLAIYSMDSAFHTEVKAQSYLEYTVQDFDGDGLDEVVIVQRERDTGQMHLSLLRAVDRHIDITDSVPLGWEADTPLQVITGRLWDGSTAVYIDESLLGSSTATEIVRVDARGLTVLAGGNQQPLSPASPFDEESLPAADPVWENYSFTIRDGAYLSRDYDGDGMIEVPDPRALPGNLFEGSENPLMRLNMMRLTADGFLNPYAVLVNEDQGYLIFLPENWVNVSVLVDGDSSIWRFYLIDETTREATAELLRIQVDSAPAESSGHSILLGNRGNRYYYGYIPLTIGDVPAITEEDLAAMFRLLS